VQSELRLPRWRAFRIQGVFFIRRGKDISQKVGFCCRVGAESFLQAPFIANVAEIVITSNSASWRTRKLRPFTGPQFLFVNAEFYCP